MNVEHVHALLQQGTEPLLKALRLARVRMSYQRALRCVKDGIGGIHLPAIRIAGRWHTSPDAVRDFVARTTTQALRDPSSIAKPTPLGTGVRYLRALGLDRESLLKREAGEGSQPNTPSRNDPHDPATSKEEAKKMMDREEHPQR